MTAAPRAGEEAAPAARQVSGDAAPRLVSGGSDGVAGSGPRTSTGCITSEVNSEEHHQVTVTLPDTPPFTTATAGDRLA